MANATQNVNQDQRARSLTDDIEQRGRYLIESGSVPDDDDLVVTPDLTPDEGTRPPVSIEIYQHDGGLDYSAATATVVATDAETLVLEFWDPDVAGNDSFKAPNEAWTSVTHTLAGVTGGAATPAQVAASLNGDTNVTKWGYAAISATNVVTIFPRGAKGRVRVGNGSTSAALAALFSASGTANNAVRTFTRVIQTELWDVVHAPSVAATESQHSTTISNRTGGAITKVAVAVSYI